MQVINVYETAAARGYVFDPSLVLNRSELVVFQALGRGENNSAIAEALNRDQKTITTHTARIRDKLGLASINQVRAVAALKYAAIGFKPVPPVQTKPKLKRAALPKYSGSPLVAKES